MDSAKNPLTCNEKRDIILENLIENLKTKMKSEFQHNVDTIEKINDIRVNVICMNDIPITKSSNNPIMNSIFKILGDYGYPETVNITLHLVIGQDRETSYEWIGKTMSAIQPPVLMNIEALLRPSDAMSATYIRKLVSDNNKDDFTVAMTDIGLDTDTIDTLFLTLQNKLIVPDRKSKTIKRLLSPSKTLSKTKRKKGGMASLRFVNKTRRR
jgi:hypothetical protein